MMSPLRIAVAGLGTVGGGVVRVLMERGDELALRAGRPLELVAVSARNRGKRRDMDLHAIPWADDARELAHSNADVVVELIGGENGVAQTLGEAALRSGKHLVTANKALLAHRGAMFAKIAEENGVQLRFEAAVAGG